MDLTPFLAASRASAEFVADVLRYCTHGAAPRVRTVRYAPAIKVQRLLAHLLATEPHLDIEGISIDGYSGCSDFRGVVEVQTADGPYRFEFVWDCRWRAEQEGWTDYFGFPDQIRAAQEYGWRCFHQWRAVEPESLPADAQLSIAR